MIEFIAEDLCTGCNKCVEVCSEDVFDATDGAVPIIARLDDCTTCRQCALYCPEGAVFVALLNHPMENLDKQAIIASGRTTAYAKWLGWDKGSPPPGDRTGLHYEYARQLAHKRGNPKEPDPSDRVRRQLFEARERNLI
ncbi:Electron transport complex subunit RsxB [compost metagenome]